MSTLRKVTLEGGPRHGDVIEIDATLKAITLEWEEESLFRDYDGTTVYVTRVGLAHYVFTDEPGIFEHRPTPTALGDAARIMRGDR